jgi:hypothetical protein
MNSALKKKLNLQQDGLEVNLKILDYKNVFWRVLPIFIIGDSIVL